MKLNRILNSNEVDYVFFHLANHISGVEKLRSHISYRDDSSAGIVFPASSADFSTDNIVEFENIPVLFPVSDDAKPYTLQDGKVRFNHDLLKSAFYLLSGFQEVAKSDEVDKWGRFKYESSLQYKLNCVHKPLVNYYFQWIIEALVEYGKLYDINIERRMPFGRMALHLSHDIDLLRFQSFRKTAYRILQLLFLKPKQQSWKSVVKSLLSTAKYYFKTEDAENPYWSFAKILNTERYFGFKSSWYFLMKDGGPHDADYTWDDADVREMMKKLTELSQEVGLHASIKASKDPNILKQSFNKLQEITENEIVGNRMHYLTIDFPNTFKLLQETGLKYDCSMGFSKAEGFRNGYCFPYRPWDFENSKMYDLWEIPLVAMDATMFGHNNRTYEDAFNLMETLLNEATRFNGIFSLLWHNSMFDEFTNPGILKFYEDLHFYYSQYNPNSLTGKEIIERITLNR